MDQVSLITQNAAIKGTPDFMAPEQVNPKDFGEVSAKTDVYGLGAVLYFLLTGKPPFEGRAAVVVMRKVTRKAPVDPRQHAPQVPAGVADLCLRALAKPAADRPGSARELAVELAEAVGLQVPVPEPLNPTQSPAPDLTTEEGEPPSLSLPVALPLPGEQLAGCVLDRELARGGGGAVYVATAPDGSKRAIKVLLGDMRREEKQERFAREAEVGRELKHPGVVRVFGHGVERGMAYLVMEFLESARPLSEYCEQEQVSAAKKIQLMQQTADAVQAAHEVGLIHRDLKPDNVLVLSDGQVKVVDFGIARHVDKERLTMSGALLGTLHYMSPEQVMGQGAHADARTDIYAMGVMLYQLIGGRLPFEGDTGLEVMAAIMDDTPPNPCVGVDVPDGLVDVIAMAMSRKPHERYSSALSFGRDLAATSGSGTVAAVTVARSRGRTRLALTLVAVLGAFVLAVVVGVLAVEQLGRLSDEELAQRVGRVHGQAWSALTESRAEPLATEAETVAALRDELRELLERRPDAAGQERLVRAGQRLRAAEGLISLASGDLAAAQGVAETLQDVSAPAPNALRAAIAAVTSGAEPEANARLLGRAITRGIDRPEVRGWRVRLRLHQGITSAATGEEVLVDLKTLARSGSELEDHQQWAQVWALLALDRVPQAAEALAPIEGSPASLRWALVHAELTDVLEKSPKAAQAMIAGLPAVEAPSARGVALAQRSFELAYGLAKRKTLVQNRGDPDRCEVVRLTRFLRLGARLAPSVAISDRLADAALGHSSRYSSSGNKAEINLGLVLCSLRPNDLKAHARVSALADRLTTTRGLAILLPIAERAVELAPTPAERLTLDVKLVRYQARVCADRPDLIDACVRRATQLLERAEGLDRAWAYASRAWAQFYAGEFKPAIADIDDAIELAGEVRFLYWRARILYAAKLQPEVALQDAMSFVLSREDGSIPGERATVIVWELGRAANRLDLVRRAISYGLTLRTFLPGWWARLGFLHVEIAKDRTKAEHCLREAAAWFDPNRTKGRYRNKELHDQCLSVAEFYAGKKNAEGDRALRELVEALEALRLKNTITGFRGP